MPLIAEEYELLQIEAMATLAHKRCKSMQRHGGKVQGGDLLTLQDKLEAVLGLVAHIKYQLGGNHVPTAVAELRNILDTCATAPSRGYEAAVDEIHNFAAHGLKALGADHL